MDRHSGRRIGPTDRQPPERDGPSHGCGHVELTQKPRRGLQVIDEGVSEDLRRNTTQGRYGRSRTIRASIEEEQRGQLKRPLDRMCLEVNLLPLTENAPKARTTIRPEGLELGTAEVRHAWSRVGSNPLAADLECEHVIGEEASAASDEVRRGGALARSGSGDDPEQSSVDDDTGGVERFIAM